MRGAARRASAFAAQLRKYTRRGWQLSSQQRLLQLYPLMRLQPPLLMIVSRAGFVCMLICDRQDVLHHRLRRVLPDAGLPRCHSAALQRTGRGCLDCRTTEAAAPASYRRPERCGASRLRPTTTLPPERRLRRCPCLIAPSVFAFRCLCCAKLAVQASAVPSMPCIHGGQLNTEVRPSYAASSNMADVFMQVRAPSATPGGYGHGNGSNQPHPASHGEGGASGPSHARAMALAANFANRQDATSPALGQPPFAPPHTGAARGIQAKASGSGGLVSTSDSASGQLATLSGGAHNGGARAFRTQPPTDQPTSVLRVAVRICCPCSRNYAGVCLVTAPHAQVA